MILNVQINSIITRYIPYSYDYKQYYPIIKTPGCSSSKHPGVLNKNMGMFYRRTSPCFAYSNQLLHLLKSYYIFAEKPIAYTWNNVHSRLLYKALFIRLYIQLYRFYHILRFQNSIEVFLRENIMLQHQ